MSEINLSNSYLEICQRLNSLDYEQFFTEQGFLPRYDNKIVNEQPLVYVNEYDENIVGYYTNKILLESKKFYKSKIVYSLRPIVYITNGNLHVSNTYLPGPCYITYLAITKKDVANE